MDIKRPVSKTASLRDVAAKAGIGIATASSVLNGSRSNTRVSEATRKRIVDAARELRYHPNAVARALAGHPTKTLGVLFGLPRVTIAESNPFAFAVIEGILAGAAKEGYNVTLFTEPWVDAAQSLGKMRDGRVDGVIVIAASSQSDILPTLSEFGVPAVALAAAASDSPVPAVDVDNHAGSRMAVNHLLELGHRRIAHLQGDDTLSSAVRSRDGFLQALRDAGIEAAEGYVPAGTYEEKSGYERAIFLLERPDPPTAIVAANDVLAIAAIQAAHDRNVRVPEDLSVVGFDDIPMAAFIDPPLTTVHQDLLGMGTKAVRVLMQVLRGEATPGEPFLFMPVLVVRKSTAAPAVQSL
ncbi:MAG: LacI family DNA-binding transcriptional regulator [Capsulimonadaceae bacterium]|nr:LacI family DNA-binding transcriptional regulator [Capsulimonadaceae bacterium]